MLFSSLIFLYAFLPLALLCYLATPRGIKNAVLLLFSLLFYAWGEPKYLILMIASILVGYLGGLSVSHAKKPWVRKLSLGVSLGLCIAALAFFKYADFFLLSWNELWHTDLPLLKLALPIGISFYTFQILSYLIDVYRGAAPQKNPIDFAAYVSMFPQLIAGPIVRYSDVAPELKKRRHTLDASYQGACRFLIGLGKKILLANQLGALCQSYRASPESSVLYAWLYAVSYTLQIYFDFSGYSDMAIGLGSILGFHFPENFNYPYLSRSITEFWRRWHMTLGSWFRDYVYIPLGGNRVSQLKWLRNLLLVWGLTGLWHGAGWNFVFWGLYFALLLMGEKLFWGKFLQKSKLFSHIYVIFTILISFVLFNAESLGVFASDVGRMFGAGSLPFFNTESLYALRNHIFLLLFAILGATSLPKHLLEKCRFTPLGKIIPYLESVFLAVMLLLCTAYLVDGSFNPFLYFRF